MRPSGAAYDWEFRWRWLILIGSQPALALMAHAISGVEEPWYAPAFSPWTGWLAVLAATSGILLRIQATSALRACVMASDNPDTSRFVVHGVYRSVRNPLYLSSLLLFGGYGLFFGWLWAIGFVAFHGWRYHRIVRLEESCLRPEWGEDFDAYCRTVPRWLPRWRDFRSEFGRWLTWHGVIANSLYVSIWMGIAVSALQRNLGWVIPFECVGGGVMVMYYWVHSPDMAAAVAREIEHSESAPALPSDSPVPPVAGVDVPHFQVGSVDRSHAIAIFEKR